MEENKKVDVGRALTTDEIRLQSRKWNLARDVGLLAHLENFSQNLVNKSQETQKNLNALLDSLEDTSTTINNINNQFLALQNSQFVENRVYDDESPAEELKNVDEPAQEEQENYLLARYKEAVEIGVQLLDSHFEEVQLPPNSDSDEEEVSTGNSGFVWKPKNPYACKRFPLLIGSAEWWADDNVGLGEYEENINHDTLSSESETYIEAEETAEKRIRMSSSSSTESEKSLNKKSKAENPELDDIFAPVEKDMFEVQPNIYKQCTSDNYDEDNLQKSQNVPRSRTNINSLNMPLVEDEEHIRIVNSLPKKSKNSIFDEDGDSEDECLPKEDQSPGNKQNMLHNILTKELTAKLSNVSNDKEVEPKAEKRESIKTNSYKSSALFAENDDNDDLFSAKGSASNLLFKKQSIFSEINADDELFGNPGNSITENKSKVDLIISSEPTSNSNTRKGNKASNLFDEPSKFSEEDLFGNNDDFLFSGKSVLSSSRNSGISGSREVQFSTPTEKRDNQEVPQGDIFGGVSEIRSNTSSNVASVSAVSNDVDNSLNFSRDLSADTSKDDGFVEPSDTSNNKSIKYDSSGLFEPQLTSTRQITSDTSDYKTQRIFSTLPSLSNSIETEENSKSKMGQSENVHFPRHHSDAKKSISLFEEEFNEDDDLFQSHEPSKPVNGSGLFDHKETEDLFGNLSSKENNNQPIFYDEEEKSDLFQKSYVPPLDGDEEEKSSLLEKIKHDSVSMSSSRSSLFDDVNAGGKTNLASIFENDKSTKISDNIFCKKDDELFGEKKIIAFDENDGDDLFSSDALSKPKINDKDNMSLFSNLNDGDDLFSDNVKKNFFNDYEDDGALFGKTLQKDKTKEIQPMSWTTTEDIFKSEGSSTKKVESIRSGGDLDEVPDSLFGKILENDKINQTSTQPLSLTPTADIFKSEADPAMKIESIRSDGIISEVSHDLFDRIVDKSDNVLNVNNNKGVFEDWNKPETSNIFGDLEDEDEDLFANARSILKATKDDNKGLNLVKDGSEGKFLKAPSKEQNRSDKAAKDKIQIISTNGLFEDPEIQTLDISYKTNESNIGDINLNSESSERNDFFENRTSKSRLKENRKLFEVDDSDDNNLFNNVSTVEIKLPQEKSETGVRPSPPKTLNIAKGYDLESKLASEFSATDGSAVGKEKPKIIGKLNIPSNLKINPMNLLPGAVLKKTAAVEGAVQPNNSEINTGCEVWKENIGSTEIASNLLKCLSKDRVKIQAQRRPQTRRARQEALRSSGIGFDINNPEVCPAASRSKSVDNFEKEDYLPPKSNSDTNVNGSGLDNNDVESDSKILENTDSSNSIFHSVENSPEPLFSSPLVSKPLSPSTDEEDYFNVPELDTNFEREDQSIFKSDVTDFTSDDALLFDGAPVLSPMNPHKNIYTSSDLKERTEENEPIEKIKTLNETSGGIVKGKLILQNEDDWNDEDEGLFNTNCTIKPGNFLGQRSEAKSRKSNIFDDLEDGDSFLFEKKTVNILSGKVPKSLFDDNDEDDDLFTDKPVTSASHVKTIKTVNDSSVTNKINEVNVEKPKDTFIDPLGLMAGTD